MITTTPLLLTSLEELCKVCTREIPLRGHRRKAWVSNEDYVELSKHRWTVFPGYRTYYARMTHASKRLYMHHLLLKETMSGYCRDHIDRDGLNNTRGNLRLVTQSVNLRNNGYNGKSKQFIRVLERRKRGA